MNRAYLQVALRLVKRYQYSAFRGWHERVARVRAVKALGVHLHKLTLSRTASQACPSMVAVLVHSRSGKTSSPDLGGTLPVLQSLMMAGSLWSGHLYKGLMRDLWMQVYRVWQLQAMKQQHHRAILGRCIRQMQSCIQAKVLRTWSAVAEHKAEARAKADTSHIVLAHRRLKHVLKSWRAEATYLRESRRMLKVCTQGLCATMDGGRSANMVVGAVKPKGLSNHWYPETLSTWPNVLQTFLHLRCSAVIALLVLLNTVQEGSSDELQVLGVSSERLMSR